MRLRGDSKWNCENVPSGCDQPAPEAAGGRKVARSRTRKSSLHSSRTQSPVTVGSRGRRPVLREKTNLKAEEVIVQPVRGKKERGKVKDVSSDSVLQSCGGVVEKGLITEREGVGRRLRASPQIKGDEEKKSQKFVSGRRSSSAAQLAKKTEKNESDGLEIRRERSSSRSPQLATENGSKSSERIRRTKAVLQKVDGKTESNGVETRGKRGSSQSPQQTPNGSKGLGSGQRKDSFKSPNQTPNGSKGLGSGQRKDSFKSPKQVAGEGSSKEDSVLVGRRLCVYMNAAADESCKPTLPSKESVYEFEVDGSEPPSRRRRRKGRGATAARGKKKVFPRFPRVRFPSRSETTASSVESVATLSSFDLGSTASERTVHEGPPSFASAASSCKPTFVPPMACAPRSAMTLRKRLSTVLESPLNSPATSMSALGNSPDKGVVVDSFGDSRLKVNEVASSCGETTPSKVPRKSPLAPLHQNSIPCRDNSLLLADEVGLDHREKTPSKAPPVTASSILNGNSQLSHTRVDEEPSFGASVLTNLNSSFALGFAHHHSTPVKARSGSDSSTNFSHSQANDATADKCFGFSSDDDSDGPEGVDGLPSPLLASPRTWAQRQALLMSSPPQLAPSRFAPEVVRRALILEAVSRPLQFDGVRHKGGQSRCALPSAANNLKKTKKTSQRTKKGRKDRLQGIDEYLLKRQAVEPPEKIQDGVEEGAVVTPSSSPPAASLFGDAKEEEAVEEEVVAPLSVRPPRRSYERPWNRKLKKVIGGGLCLDSSDEEDERGGERTRKEREEEKQEEEEVEAPPKVVPPPKPRHRTKATEDKENQMDQWATQINSQFNEVEDFELCLG
ncbi:uncharacterized protein LOC124167973 isoform X2 [Ischnura elegans]|uniref:uncharacterized protein LOC124167973 isoform X2 n=1 Tax=Ischnura elegans TaxID=197161 RepID=UPI001ED86667|nr:uncharacterized protein LOC124167973 isoform X2 [Ischnura elegans]